jgi:hypothetical protein
VILWCDAADVAARVGDAVPWIPVRRWRDVDRLLLGPDGIADGAGSPGGQVQPQASSFGSMRRWRVSHSLAAGASGCAAE